MNFIYRDSEDIVEVYLIVNDKVEKKRIPQNEIFERNGHLYHEYNYGMGAIHWPIVDSPLNAYKRQLEENVLWATDRLSWAKKHCPKEVNKLQEIIDTKGKSRSPEYYEKLKRIDE